VVFFFVETRNEFSVSGIIGFFSLGAGVKLVQMSIEAPNMINAIPMLLFMIWLFKYCRLSFPLSLFYIQLTPDPGIYTAEINFGQYID
jgi:hypothetical protein